MQAMAVQIAEKTDPAPAAPPARKRRARTFGSYIADRQKRASRMLGYALVLNDANAWQGASVVFAARLEQGELIGLAFAALRALEPEPREAVFDLAHWGETEGAGPPLPPFAGVMDDARWWASFASRRELKAYALASFEAMSPRDRAAFLEHVAKGKE